MAALRCVIDAMIFDAVAAEPATSALVDRLTSARRLELLAAAATMAEIAATPDRAHRRALGRVRVLVVPPPDPHHPMLDALLLRPGVSETDAGVAVTAALHEVPLVTQDAALRLAAAELLPGTALWTWHADLRPRIEALGLSHPGPPLRR